MTDGLLSYDIYEIEKKIDSIVTEYRKCCNDGKDKTERGIRDGLKSIAVTIYFLTA